MPRVGFLANFGSCHVSDDVTSLPLTWSWLPPSMYESARRGRGVFELAKKTSTLFKSTPCFSRHPLTASLQQQQQTVSFE